MSEIAWDRIETILADALEREPGQRDEFIAEVCGGDEVLRARVLELLDHEREAREAFDIPTGPALIEQEKTVASAVAESAVVTKLSKPLEVEADWTVVVWLSEHSATDSELL